MSLIQIKPLPKLKGAYFKALLKLMFPFNFRKKKYSSKEEFILNKKSYRSVYNYKPIKLNSYSNFFNQSTNDSFLFPFVRGAGLEAKGTLETLKDIPLSQKLGLPVHLSTQGILNYIFNINKETELTTFLYDYTESEKGLNLEIHLSIKQDEKENIFKSHYLIPKSYHSKESKKNNKPKTLPEFNDKILFEGVIAHAKVKKYANISGDLNPIHLSKFFAKLVGYKSPVVHGLYLGALGFATLVKNNELKIENLKNFKLEFLRPLFCEQPFRIQKYSEFENTFSILKQDKELWKPAVKFSF